MIILFTVMLLVLLATGLPVGFALGTGGLVGMLLFMGGDGTLNQIPLLAYKSLDDFVLCAVPLYVLMSQILLEGKVETICSNWATNGCGICPAVWARRPSWPAAFLPQSQAHPQPVRLPSAPLPFRKC